VPAAAREASTVAPAPGGPKVAQPKADPAGDAQAKAAERQSEARRARAEAAQKAAKAEQEAREKIADAERERAESEKAEREAARATVADEVADDDGDGGSATDRQHTGGDGPKGSGIATGDTENDATDSEGKPKTRVADEDAKAEAAQAASRRSGGGRASR
jgi:colicin import membrane protein